MIWTNFLYHPRISRKWIFFQRKRQNLNVYCFSPNSNNDDDDDDDSGDEFEFPEAPSGTTNKRFFSHFFFSKKMFLLPLNRKNRIFQSNFFFFLVVFLVNHSNGRSPEMPMFPKAPSDRLPTTTSTFGLLIFFLKKIQTTDSNASSASTQKPDPTDRLARKMALNLKQVQRTRGFCIFSTVFFVRKENV